MDVPDYELEKPVAAPSSQPPPGRPTRKWIVAAVLAAAALSLVAIVFFGDAIRGLWSGPAVTAPPTEGPVRVEVPEPALPLGGAADSIVVPSLDLSDPAVRQLVKTLTSHPRVAAWLATSDLIRTFAAVVSNVAEGKTPSSHLPVLRPSAGFRVIEGRGGLEIAPASYARYDGIADAVASIDPLGAARVYATLKPRIEDAYRELGYPDTPFDRTLERALVSLLKVPILDGPVRVVARTDGIGYAYAAKEIEALTEAQKHLARTGPRNTRMIQSSLRDIALALGIPAERLPAPRP
jgi:hypothetical protein